ncbi:2'-5' RNA ligase family protein [Vibrio fluvialis]|uniref:2'-5' RNA ligase family protein n=1 Tax=Vibrio fluvialis TaxID=676 RepID=UPI00155974BD|nr:hypothetical protein [Vibrio fluvialis]EKO3954144.1 hypothetical protein [Vibrio fluvialis]
MIESIYQNMWDNFSEAVRDERYVQDPYLKDKADTRRGITALAYLLQPNSPLVTANIDEFLHQVRKLEPEQYFYPQNELHLTLLSVISCEAGFQLSDIDIDHYADVFLQALSHVEPIEIEFRGVSASPECIVIQGYPIGNGLSQLRDQLRSGFKKSGLRTSVDSRYKLVTAHASAVRFRSPMNDAKALRKLCQQFRQHSFGRLNVSACELVFNNWYQQRAVTQLLAQCSLSYPVSVEK